jgi:hypothetical protein
MDSVGVSGQNDPLIKLRNKRQIVSASVFGNQKVRRRDAIQVSCGEVGHVVPRGRAIQADCWNKFNKSKSLIIHRGMARVAMFLLMPSHLPFLYIHVRTRSVNGAQVDSDRTVTSALVDFWGQE